MIRTNIDNPVFLQQILKEKGLEVDIEICERCLEAISQGQFRLQAILDGFILVNEANFEYALDLVECLNHSDNILIIEKIINDATDLYLKYLSEDQRSYILTDNRSMDKLRTFAYQNNIPFSFSSSVYTFLPNEITMGYLEDNHQLSNTNTQFINHCYTNAIDDQKLKSSIMVNVENMINEKRDDIIETSISELKQLFKPIEK